jgi:hypothetical protein
MSSYAARRADLHAALTELALMLPPSVSAPASTTTWCQLPTVRECVMMSHTDDDRAVRRRPPVPRALVSPHCPSSDDCRSMRSLPPSGFALAVQSVCGQKARSKASLAPASAHANDSRPSREPSRVDVLPPAPVLPVGRDLSFLFHTTDPTPTILPIAVPMAIIAPRPASLPESVLDSGLQVSASGCVSAASLPFPLPLPLARPVVKPGSAHTSPGRPPQVVDHRPTLLTDFNGSGPPRAQKTLVYPPLHQGSSTATVVTASSAFSELIKVRRRGLTDIADWLIDEVDMSKCGPTPPSQPVSLKQVKGAPFSFARALQTFKTAQRGTSMLGVSQTLFDDD